MRTITKLTVLVGIFLFSSTILFAQQLIDNPTVRQQRISSTNKFSQDENISVYTRSFISFFLMANGDLVIERLTQRWENNAWVNDTKNSFTYDADENMIEILIQRWQNNAWENLSRYSYNYDGNGNKIEELRQLWQNNIWVNFQKTIFIYDSNGNKTQEIEQ
ncbi:MAG: hypothetical protein ACE5GL_01445, partial [Calditrichia bacterium]